jgi:hypothetical protein
LPDYHLLTLRSVTLIATFNHEIIKFTSQHEQWMALGSLLQANERYGTDNLPALEFNFRGNSFCLFLTNNDDGDLVTCLSAPRAPFTCSVVRTSGAYQAQTNHLEKFLQYMTPEIMERISLFSILSISASYDSFALQVDGFVASLEQIQPIIELACDLLRSENTPYR